MAQSAGVGRRYLFVDWGSLGGPSGSLYYWQIYAGLRELRIGAEDRPLGLCLKGFGGDANGEIYLCDAQEIGPFGQTGQLLKFIPVEFIVHLSAVTQNNQVLLQWEGGVGLFIVERKNFLEQDSWATFRTTTSRSLLVPLSEPSGFFRFRDEGQSQ